VGNNLHNYILIVPIKDEEKNLSLLENSIINQTIKPIHCVLVDSGSTDNSLELLKNIFGKYRWISIIQQKKFFEKGYGHLNFAQAINEGYALVKKRSEENDFKYEFVGKTDATPLLAENYFECLQGALLEDNSIAFVCGLQEIHNEKKEVITINPQFNFYETAINDIRLYRKSFFELIGGYPLTPSPDTVLYIKAINRGWNVKRVTSTKFIKYRPDATKIGTWEGYKLRGKMRYNLGYRPIFFAVSSFENSFRLPPHYQFLPLLEGYFLSFFKREKRIDDQEILKYFGTTRMKELLNSLFS
jgi:glycosyltransferase involved in cell wall biosynthesis